MQEENENLKDDVAVGPKEYQELLNNFDKIDTLTKRLVIALSSKTPDPAVKTQPSQELYYKASAKYFSEILSNPTKLIENQVKYYKSTLENWTNIQNEILKVLVPIKIKRKKQKRLTKVGMKTYTSN